MNPRIRKTYIRKIHHFFEIIERDPWFVRLMALPYSLRVFLSAVLSIVGLIALVTPIPAGSLMIGLSCTMIWGLRPVRRETLRLFFSFRIPTFISWYYRIRRRFFS